MKERTERKIRNKKVMIALMEYIVTLGCLLVAFVMISGKKIEQTSSYAKPEEVTKYEVVDNEYLTRVRPLTTYEAFKKIAENTLNKQINVYKDANKTEGVIDGIITSGMVLEVINDETDSVENNDYTICVVGDLTKDGDCNVTELTRIIRDVVGLEIIENREEQISIDFNKDGKVDVVDITMCIRYIVYGELPADLDIDPVPDPEPEPEPEPEPQPDPEPVNIPDIVVTGEGNTDWYRSDVRVEIQENGENIEKTLSRFEINLKDEDETRIQSTGSKKILIRDEGKYKITSQSFGKDGGKSELVTKEINIDKTKPTLTLSREDIDKTSCKIVINGTDDNGIRKYRIQKEDEEEKSSEEINEQEIRGTITVTEDGKYKVTVEDLAGNTTEKEINIKGVSTRYIVTFKNEDGSIISEKEYLEDEILEIPQNPSKQEDNTYTYEFAGWSPEVEETVSGNKEYIATYRSIYKNYTVTFKNEDGTVLSTKNDYHYGDTVAVPQNPTKQEDNTYTYEFAGWKTIGEDGEEVIVETIDETITKSNEYTATYNSIYRNYTVTFKNEDESIIATKNDYHYGYKIQIPENPSKEQDEIYTYEFKGWKNKAGEMAELSEETEVLANEEYTAVYESEYREYTITFWNEDKSEVIYSEKFTAIDKEITEPEIIQDREGYIGYWTYYELENKDIDVQLYYVIKRTNGETIEEIIGGITWRGTYQDGKAINVYYESGELEETVIIPATLEGYQVKSLNRKDNNTYFNIYHKYIEKIIIPKTVISIGDNVFQSCENLININIRNVENLGDYALGFCPKLIKIEMPNIRNIGRYAFCCSELSKIEIPATIENIGIGAFDSCNNLIEINVDNNNQNYSSEEGVLFNKDKSIIIKHPAKKENMTYKIPDTVTSIEDKAFQYCSNLTNIEIPNSVTNIDFCAFSYCYKLNDIEIPNSVTSIDANAFYYCYDLKNIEIPNSVTNISSDAFNECYNLSDISIDNIEENITLGQNWNSRAYVHFNDCKHNVTFTNMTDGLHIEEVKNSLKDGIIKCGETYQFKLVNDNTDEVVKDKVARITSQGKYTNYSNVEENILPDEDGIYTIKNINRNKSIIFSEIQNRMQIQCKINEITWECTIQDGKAENLHYVDGELGENVEIPSEIYGYQVVSLDNNWKSIFYKEGENYNKIVREVQLPYCITTIGNSAFNGCLNLKIMNIPSNVTKIGSGVFSNCINLSDIYIDNLEKNIELSDDLNQYAYVHFNDCKHDISFEKYTNRKVTIETVSEDGQDGHIECNEDYQFKILDKDGKVVTNEKVLIRLAGTENNYYDDYRRLVENLNKSSNLFANEEEGIREVTPGEDGIYTIENVHRNVTIIIGSYEIEDENQIEWNYSIKDGKAINVYYAEGPLQETVVIPSEIDGYPVESLYNKEESGNIFAKAENASLVKNVIIQNGVTKIGRYAFYKLQNLETIQIPNSVTNIGFAAFFNCENLKEIEIPSSVSNIKALTFYKCIGLQDIKIPNSIIEMGMGVFANCSSLESIELSNSLKSIPDYTFIGCEKLKEIDVPDSVLNICDNAFDSCYELENINMTNVQSIGNSAFAKIQNLKQIHIPQSTVKLKSPFNECTSLNDIYVENSKEEIQILINNGNWNSNWFITGGLAEVHYKNCEHSITFKNYTDENVNIDFIDKNTNYENVPCGRTIQFRLLKDNELVKNRTIYIYNLNTTRNLETEREINPDQDGIYTIDNVRRDCAIAVGKKYRRAVDQNGIMWEYTYENGNATKVHYYAGQLNSTVEIPSRLNNYPVVSLYNEQQRMSIGILGDYNHSIQNIIIPEGVTSIGENAFYYYSRLINIEIPESITSVGKNAFYGTPYYNNFPDGEVYIGKALYGYKGNMPENTSITVREGTVTISDDTFRNCYNLRSIVFPESLKKIGKNAFYQSGNFTTIELPEIAYIGDNAFYDNYSLSLADIYIDNEESNITLGENWNWYAFVHFRDCMHDINIINEFKDVTLQEVSDNLINGKIKCGETYQFKIINNGDYIPVIKVISQGRRTDSSAIIEEITPDENGIYTISNINRNKTIRIGRNNGEQLQAEDENGITWNYTYQDGNATKVYYESGELGKTVSIPNELDGYPVVQIASNSAGKSIFKEKSQNIKNIIIPNSIIDIGHFAFYGCNGLTNIEIPSSVTNIDYNAFSDCSNLSDYYIDNESGKYSYNFKYNNGYIHYKDCKHTISFDLDSENIMAIEQITENEAENMSVNCGETFKFRLINTSDNSIIHNKKLFARSEGKFHHSGYIIEALSPDEEGIYTIENINRDKTIIETIENGMKVIATDENNITWQFTYQDGKAEDVHYYDGELTEHVEIPSELNGCPVVSLYNSEFGGGTSIFAKEYWASNENIKTVQIPNTVTTIGNYAFNNCVNISTINIPSNVTKMGYTVFNGCISLTNIYIDNLEENILIDDDLNRYAYVHYSDCKHDISFEKYTNEDIELQTVGEKGQDGHIECNENYQFKLIDKNEDPVTTEKVLVRYAGLENEIDEDARDYYDRVRSMLDNSSNMFASEEEGIRELQVGEDGIYTVEKVHRNITIIVGSYQTTDANNITWNYSIENDKAINVYYAGGELTETVTIPSELDGHQVVNLYNKEESGNIFAKAENPEIVKNVVIQNGITRIDKYAFYKLRSLETITIPDSVTEIGDASFYSCESLKEINIPTRVTTIGAWAFNCCIGLTNIEIPDSVTEIGKAAFSTCKNLESIRLSINLSVIEDNLFINCEKLNNIKIPENITSVGNRAFYNCSSIEDIVIPDTVTEIKEYAFYSCNSLSEINIPDHVTELNENTFSWCNNLISIEIPSSVTKLNAPFSGCSNLKDIYIDNYEENLEIKGQEGKPWYNMGPPVNAQIHYKDCTHSIKLIKYMEDSTEIESVIEGVDNESIPCRSNYQFKLVKDGEVIKNKTLTITELGITSYYNVEKEIEPNEEGIYTIENISRDYIIEIGEKYQHATDENGITWEYEYEEGKATNVHYYSGDLGTHVEIPSILNGYSVISLNNENSNEEAIGLFGKGWGGPQSVKILEGTITIGNNAFRGYSNLTSIELPNSVSNIGQSAFEDCHALQSINLPDGITNIGSMAFYNCSSLESIELPESLTVIEDSMFSSCTNLKNIIIKNNIKEIKYYAFGGCNSLEELIIPNSVTTIRYVTFSGCNSLVNLTISDNITNIDSCDIEYTPYYNNLPNGEFYMGKVLYKYKGEMPENTTIIVKDGTETLKGSAFYKQNNLISIELPDSVTRIERDTFRNCSNLSSVTMSKNIKYIGEAAFENCTSLSNIVIWKSVEELRERTFDRWTNEQTVNFEAEEVQEGWAEDWNKGCNAQIVFGYTGE